MAPMSTPEHVIDESAHQPRHTIDVVTAGFFERFAAALVDLFLPYCFGLLTFFLWPRPEVMESSDWNAIDRFVDGYNADPWLVWAPMLTIATTAFGWHTLHGLKGKETPGRRLLKLRLISSSGQKATGNEVMKHSIARILSVLPFMLGHLWLLADPEKRTLHDRITGLYVVCANNKKNTGTVEPTPRVKDLETHDFEETSR